MGSELNGWYSLINVVVIFRPSLDDASVHMRAACSLLEKIESTISLGLSAPNDCDGRLISY